MLPELIDRDNRQHFVADGDFMDSESIGAGHFASTGLSDEPPVREVANGLADALDDALSEISELTLAQQQRPWTLEQAQEHLAKNAEGYALGLSETVVGYVGINIKSFKGVARNCTIRVIPAHGATPAQIANPIQFEGPDWATTVDRCLSVLFPNPQAA